MPIPQCQDLLYPPSTYLVILWANFGLLCILDKASRSLRVWNRPRCQRDGRLKKLQAEGPPSYLLRLILGIATLYVAFHHPSVRFPGTGTVLFSPATPAISTLSNTLIGSVASVILLLAYDVLGASSLVENVPTASRKVVEHTSMGIHPVTSLSPKRYRVRPKSHTPRRPTLTPETFSPIAPEGTTAGQSKYRPKSAKSPLVPKGETPPLRSQYLLSDKLMAPGDYVDAKDTNMYNEIEPSVGIVYLILVYPNGFLHQANTLLPCPHTKPRRLVEAGFEHIIITTEQDPSHEFTEPFVRPGSRLGFSSNRRKYGSIRVIDDEYEMEGAAAGLDMVWDERTNDIATCYRPHHPIYPEHEHLSLSPSLHIQFMENITFLSSGALNRAHYALVAKQERALSPEEADKAAWDVIEEVKNRMIRRPVETITSSIGDLFAAGARGWGFNIPYSNAVWNSRQAREDLLLLLYCQDSLTTEKRSVSSHGLFFALPTALTLAEAGTTVEQRRTGYLFCSQVLPLGHEMQLLVINTVGKHLDSPSIPNILLALDYLINAPNSDAIPAINSRLQDLLAHKSPQVRQRVMHAFRVLAVLDSDLLFRCKAGLQLNMQNADPIVRGAALSLLLACFENNVVDSAFVEATILEVIQRFRPSKANVPSIRLTTKAVEILGKTLNKLELNLQNAAIALFGLATKAGSRGIWSLALAAFRVLSQIPQEICIKALALKDDASRPLNNSLYFLKPLLRQVDLNLVSLLLQCLVLLPPIIWTGGSVGTAESKKMTTDGHTKGSLPDDMDANELFGEEAGKSAEGEAFPEDKVSASITFPSLFSEEEVGTIVSFLKSKDIMIRKLTILVLSRADPLESGIVYQYYHQMLDRLSSNDTTVGIQTDLASQALEVAEVLCYDDPMVYASLVTEILSRADTLIGKTEVASPTLSSRSGVSTSTQQTRGRGGVIESAVEMVITRVRKGKSLLP
ncbi:hypothetical protein FRC15_011413 [Serendipita sp. 397]|nr:hypothetical protein FRC15_011413 [Serendipita sp. 397]